MTRKMLSLVALGALSLGACQPAEVVVTAEIERMPAVEGGDDTMLLENVIVDLIPFDRDAVFDSLAAAAETPEPEIPAEVLEAQEEIADAREEWQSLETEWGSLRDSLQTVSEELEQYSRGEARYVALYREFQDLEAQYNRVDRQKDRAFAEFDSLSRANLEAAQAVKIERQNWEEDAFAEVGQVFDAKLDAAGRDILTDTTSADGIARFTVSDPGQWWVHARYETATSELYWNVPLEVPRGETVEIVLRRENAEVRTKL